MLSLIQRAAAAFARDVEETPPITLRGGAAIDGYDTPPPYDPMQDAEDDGYVGRFSFAALPHLDPQSWRHYLPLLLSHALRAVDDRAMVSEALVSSLRPPDWFPPRLGSLTDDQAAVVREALQWLASKSPGGTVGADAQEALSEWWLTDAHSRPSVAEIEALRGAPTIYRRMRDAGYRLDVPATLTASGPRDVPSELRRAQTWGGVVCGDVHMTIAVNVHSGRPSIDEMLARYAGHFGVAASSAQATVPGARRAMRLDAVTPVAGRSGAELVTIVAADSHVVVTLTIRAAVRVDIRDVMSRVARSLEIGD